MSKITIYHKPSDDIVFANELTERVWDADMLVKTIDASDPDAVATAKEQGWQSNPQAVIDEIEGEKLQAEIARMQRQVDIATADKRIADLQKQVDDLTAENAKLKADSETADKRIADLQKKQVDDLTAENAKLKADSETAKAQPTKRTKAAATTAAE